MVRQKKDKYTVFDGSEKQHVNGEEVKMAHNANWVYMTASNREEAVKIGERLVESKLAACINIFENMTSIFMWEGKLEQGTEVAFIAKTTAGKIPELVEAVKSMHSYDVPCIISLPVSDGNPDFINWISESVEG